MRGAKAHDPVNGGVGGLTVCHPVFVIFVLRPFPAWQGAVINGAWLHVHTENTPPKKKTKEKRKI